MKRIGLILLAFTFIATSAIAQPGQGRQFSPEEMAKRQTEEIGEYVKYTSGQQTKVQDLNLKYAKKTMELRSGGSFRDMSENQRLEMRKKTTALQVEKDKEMKKILTAEQAKKYDEYRKDQQERMQQRRQN